MAKKELCLLAKDYDGRDPTGWWMSEKLDGVRAIWDGRQLSSRNGNPFAAPTSWLAQLPKDRVLDGELWIGRKQFDATISAVRKKIPIVPEWSKIGYHVFDCLNIPDATFEERQAMIPPALRLPQVKVKDEAHFKKVYNDLLVKGSEGVMLRQPESPYLFERSDILLKMKPLLMTEAVVVGHLPGKGKHEGRLGALQCRMGDITFQVGTGFSDAQRRRPPGVGSVVTVGYQELTKSGVPRFPVFIAERNYE